MLLVRTEHIGKWINTDIQDTSNDGVDDDRNIKQPKP
jgi:hypothetical protein